MVFLSEGPFSWTSWDLEKFSGPSLKGLLVEKLGLGKIPGVREKRVGKLGREVGMVSLGKVGILRSFPEGSSWKSYDLEKFSGLSL